MGFMSNPEEDKKLASREYQLKIVEGIYNGINLYFSSYSTSK
jgi:N-acetylmuramoyl-L-alanine amidase